MFLASLALTLATLTGCARAKSAGYWIESESSRYTPSVRVWMRTAAHDGEVTATIDSGVVSVPGTLMSDSPVLMSNLRITALLVVPEASSFTPVTTERYPDLRGWRPIATSESLPLAPELRYGEQRAVSPLQFLLPKSDVPVDATWLILRITGDGILYAPPATPGGAPRRETVAGMVSVYACGERSVAGRLDAHRVAQMRERYGELC